MSFFKKIIFILCKVNNLLSSDKYGLTITTTKLSLRFRILWKDKKRHAIIRNNRNYLENNIQLNDELIASLFSLNCITYEQSHFIQRQSSTQDKNYELLYIMESFDEKKFSHFVNCLRRTSQRTVAKIIENGGGV